MIGTITEKDFDFENFENFYENHTFVPFSDQFSTQVHKVVPRFAWGFDMVGKYKPRNLLDLGSSDGSFALTVCKNYNIPVLGVDLTKDGVTLANKRADMFGLDATFHQGVIEEFLEALDKDSFDMVSMFEVIEHVKDPQALIRAIDRVLAPGGKVLVSTPMFESPLYGKDDEQNKCHIRLYTTREEDYEEVNKYGNLRKATSIVKEIGKDRILDIQEFNELMQVVYE